MPTEKTMTGFVLAAAMGLFLMYPGYAQPNFTLTYSLKEDLVYSQVRALYQDAQGYIWFGTQGGLSRFDGLYFTNFTIDDGLVSNYVNGFAEDHRGRLWIATDKGISIYDGASFTSMTVDDGLIENQVNTLHGTPTGDVWIGYRSGISLYDEETIKHVPLGNISSPDVLSLFTDTQGNLWTGTTSGVCVLKNDGTTCYNVDDGLPHPVIQDVLIDSKERVWVATPNGTGLLLPDSSEDRFIAPDHLPQDNIRALLEDKYGDIWIGTGSGVYLVNPDMEVTHSWDDSIWLGRTLLEDREGTIWTEAMGLGIGQFIRTAFSHESVKLGLPEDVYLCVYQAPDGSMWFGSVLRGLFHLKNGQLTHYTLQIGPT